VFTAISLAAVVVVALYDKQRRWLAPVLAVDLAQVFFYLGTILRNPGICCLSSDEELAEPGATV